MLTARGLALLVGAAVLWGVGRLLGTDELLVVAASAAALVVAAWVLLRVSAPRLTLRREVSDRRLGHGAQADVCLQLRHDGRVPAPSLLITDQVDEELTTDIPRFLVAGLRPKRTVPLRYRLHGGQRGRYRVGPASLRLSDPFGLARRVRHDSETAEVVVYPRVEPLPRGPAARVQQGSTPARVQRVEHSGEEFHTMREYVQGDDLRRVHWPSTARQRKLMVRQHERPWHTEATVLLDTRGAAYGRGEPSAFEAAVSTAASVASHLAEHRYEVRLATDTDASVPPAGPLATLLERLATVGPSAVPNLTAVAERLRRGGAGMLVACVAAPVGGAVVDAADTRALLHAGRGFGARTAIVVHAPAQALRARELAALLSTAGWRATAHPAGAPLAPTWTALAAPRPRRATPR